MRVEQIHRASGVGITVLCLIASAMVFQAVVRALIDGAVPPPAADEGTAAHIFQLSVVGLVPVGICLLATMDWAHPWKTVRWLVVPLIALSLAFGLLLYIEQVYYPAHYPPAR